MLIDSTFGKESIAKESTATSYGMFLSVITQTAYLQTDLQQTIALPPPNSSARLVQLLTCSLKGNLNQLQLAGGQQLFGDEEL